MEQFQAGGHRYALPRPGHAGGGKEGQAQGEGAEEVVAASVRDRAQDAVGVLQGGGQQVGGRAQQRAGAGPGGKEWGM